MEKILAPADRVLSEIGRLVLVRPWVSGLLLLTATIITLLDNHVFNHSFKHSPATQTVVIPAASILSNTKDSLLTPAEAETTTTADVTPTATTIKPGATAKSATKKIPSSNGGLHYISGTIRHSLLSDARKAGLSSKQVNQLAQMFGAKNLRAGDRFGVVYEEPKVIKGKKYTGSVMAAQVSDKGNTYQLIRYTDPKGHTDYYTPEGQSRHAAILRQPLNYTHISSGFSYNRFDPVLHYSRPHLGVDFAAPSGTPIKAAGDGVVEEVGYKGGYGRAVVIRHDGKFSTLYGHMSRFANLRQGQTVQQGQVIGYVGSSGFATGPHLHYEIRTNNTPVNPLTTALPGALIPAAYRAHFMMQSRMLLAQLNSKHSVQLAERTPTTKRS